MTTPYEEGELVLPSPYQLKGKIIIKNKKLPGAAPGATSIEREEADSDFEEEQFVNDLSSGISFLVIHSTKIIPQMMRWMMRMISHYLLSSIMFVYSVGLEMTSNCHHQCLQGITDRIS